MLMVYRDRGFVEFLVRPATRISPCICSTLSFWPPCPAAASWPRPRSGFPMSPRSRTSLAPATASSLLVRPWDRRVSKRVAISIETLSISRPPYLVTKTATYLLSLLYHVNSTDQILMLPRQQ